MVGFLCGGAGGGVGLGLLSEMLGWRFGPPMFGFPKFNFSFGPGRDGCTCTGGTATGTTAVGTGGCHFGTGFARTLRLSENLSLPCESKSG